MSLVSTQSHEKHTAKPVQFSRQEIADYVEFRTSGAILALCSQRSVDSYNAGATSPESNRSAILEFRVADVDAERLRLDSIVSEWA